MKDRFYLKAFWHDEWTEVTRAQYIHAERKSGLFPTCCPPNSPAYSSTTATGSFTTELIAGRCEYAE